jgi:peptidoglycan/xylan/chitin deacetylase (PgdA/CDA1 family)
MASARRLLRRAWRHLFPRPKGPTILAYHRVATPAVDPWDLSVSPASFESQMEALSGSRPVLPLDEFVQRHRAGNLPHDAVAITFDDGYRDNATNAAPILARLGLPATLFVATGSVGTEREYWWDELARLVLLADALVDREVDLLGEMVRLDIDATPDPAAARTWRASDERPGRRLATYIRVWRRLRRLDPAKIDASMVLLRNAIEAAPAANRFDFAMDRSELAELDRKGVLTLAPHTVGHVDLREVDETTARREILGSQRFCAELTGRSPVGFAYPFGTSTAATRRLLGDLGFQWACSTRSRSFRALEPDLFDLPRRRPPSGGGDKLLAMLA